MPFLPFLLRVIVVTAAAFAVGSCAGQDSGAGARQVSRASLSHATVHESAPGRMKAPAIQNHPASQRIEVLRGDERIVADQGVHMMLEAYVTVPRKGNGMLADVLGVKPAGSPWSEMERSFGLVVKWDDPELAARLEARIAQGEENPVMAYPYAVYEEVREEIEGLEEVVQLRRKVMQSSVALDIGALPPDLQQKILDPDQTTEILSWEQIKHAVVRR